MMNDHLTTRGSSSIARADSKKSGFTQKSGLTWASSQRSLLETDEELPHIRTNSNATTTVSHPSQSQPVARNNSNISHFGTSSSSRTPHLFSSDAPAVGSAALAPLPSPHGTRLNGLTSYSAVSASSTSSPGKVSTLLSNEQRKRMEIAVHRATKYSCDKSFDARDSYVHFAQHGMRVVSHEPNNIWNLSDGESARGGGWKAKFWQEEAEASAQARAILKSTRFAFMIVTCLFIALLGTDVCVLCQIPGNVALDIILTFILIIFSTEIVGLAFVDIFYRGSFYFWMDVLGTMSLVCDISYLLGSDASKPEDYSGSSLLFRGFHAAHLFSRVGRLCRVVRIFRLMQIWHESDDADNVKMTCAISKQLRFVLPTRMAFLTILVALILPLFPMFKYPTTDESLSAWAEILSASVIECVRSAHNSSMSDLARHDLNAEVMRFARFYANLPYGPFQMCYGEARNGIFECRPEVIDLKIDSAFDAPRRSSSAFQVHSKHLQIWYNLSSPQQVDAATNICMILFIIVLMWVSGISMSGGISAIALQPLEKILSNVRHRCSQIFKYTKDLQVGDIGEDGADSDEEENQSENGESGGREHATNEFLLLEKAIAKLAAIAYLAATAKEEEFSDEVQMEDSMMFSSMLGSGQSGNRLGTLRSGSMMPEQVISGGLESDDMNDTSLLTSMTNAIPHDVMESLNQATFNSLDLQKDVKITVASYLALISEGSLTWVRANIQESQLYAFVSAVESKYLPNPFHNFAHAVDVLNCLYRFMPTIASDEFLPDFTHFWLMIAAIGHDIGHIGVNNQYLVEISHELALTYNDRSPLENMHCAKLYQVLSEKEANIFARVDKEVCKEMRKGMIAAILHTDVTKHNDMIKELSLLYQMNSDAFDTAQGIEVLQSQAHTQLITNALLHFADINNPMRPWAICKQLAFLCIDEFFAQGDMEKSAGIPVQMLNDRDKVNRPNSQIGFIEFMITPMVESMVHIFPELDELADELGKNIQRWFDIWVEQATPAAEAKEKVNGRVTKVVNRCRGLMRDRAAPPTLQARASVFFMG